MTLFLAIMFWVWHLKFRHERKNKQVRQHQTKMLLLLLLLSCFSRVRLCVTPETAAHQAHPSLGFSRQEHWSGLPFPSPTHDSEKWKGSRSVVSNSQRPYGLQPTRLLHPWDFPGKSTGVGCHCLLQTKMLLHSKGNSRQNEEGKTFVNHISDSVQNK